MCPKWSGDRPDLITVGGSKTKLDSSWIDTKQEIFESDIKKIVACVMEISINVVMSTHLYTFCGKVFLQSDGGPIGLRSTACLAAVLMKLWDQTWAKLLKRENISFYDFLRYVDDNRCFLKPLCEGWRWDGQNFSYSEKWYEEDMLSGLTDQARTTRELVCAMNSLIDFLRFEGEESGHFANDRLPTLDTEIWVCERSGTLKHSFYEKPTCPNRVLQKETALSEDCIRASLNQEVVRRLKACSLDLPVTEKQDILSRFGQKLINSGHSVQSSQYILVHGVVRYIELLNNSKLDPKNPSYRPLHCSRDYNVYDRKLYKLLANTNWYDDNSLKRKTRWRQLLPKEWSGSKPRQFSVPGMQYSTLMQVPNTAGGKLISMLSKAEPRLAKLTGFQIKYVERSGRVLSKEFRKGFSHNKCHRPRCDVCRMADDSKPTLCQVKSVVYTGVCTLCENEHKLDPSTRHQGRYVGETARSLSERAKEHMAALRRFDDGSFIVKHWALKHPELLEAPTVKFSVLKTHAEPLGRMISEALKILDLASLNSKSEWRGYRIGRLSVPLTEKEMKKQVESIEGEDKVSKVEIIKLRDRVKQHVSPNNHLVCSRKRMENPNVSTPAAGKRRRFVTSTPAVVQTDEREKCEVVEPAKCENTSVPSLHSNSPSVVYLNEAIDATEKSFTENDEESFNLREIFEPHEVVIEGNVAGPVSEVSWSSLSSNSPSAAFLYKALDFDEKSLNGEEIIENAESVKV